MYFDFVRQAICNPDQKRILEDHPGRLVDDGADFCAGAAAGHVAWRDYLPAAHPEEFAGPERRLSVHRRTPGFAGADAAAPAVLWRVRQSGP